MQPEGQRRGPSELDGVPGIWAAQGLEACGLHLIFFMIPD